MTDSTARWTEIEHLPEWDEEFYHVYTARKLGKWVMLKTLRPEYRDKPEYCRMIEQEFDVRYNLAHPNIVMINDFEDVPGLGRCIVCDDVYGTSLRKLIDTGGVTEAHIGQLRRCLPAALEYIQTNHIVHHPIRPERIIFTENIGNLKLIDVGFEQRESLSRASAADDIRAYGEVVREALDASGIEDNRLSDVADRCLRADRRRITDVQSLHMALSGERRARRFLFHCNSFSDGDGGSAGMAVGATGKSMIMTDGITVKPLKPTRSELLRYVRFGIDLYRGNGCFVPPLVIDELATLNPRRNPASEVCESQSFMAYRDGRAAGRITAIINRDANSRFGERVVRFGFVDFTDDAAVVDALFEAVAEWGRERGMTSMVGPMGFTDMDHEGMLVEGFDEQGTMATIYNYPYYPVHMERMGFSKEVDWVEYRIKVPGEVPAKMLRIADIVRKKYGLSSASVKSRSELKKKYGREFFHLINEAYAGLYGFTPLTDRMIDYYVDNYLGMLRLDDLSIIIDSDGRLAAAGIAMPSLTAALQASGGRLLPAGWLKLLRAIRGKGVGVVDLMLVAVRKDLQGKGVNSLVFCDLIPRFIAHGYREAESNLELEGNESVQRQWEYFERRQHRRRRAWRKEL